MRVMTSLLFAVLVDEANKKPARRPLDGVSTAPNFLFWAVVVLMIFGIAWKAFKAIMASRALQRLEGDKPDLEAIRDAATHGRTAIHELFRLLATGKDESVRHEAGRALASLWRADELVAEEEQALVTRAFEANWVARRKYPRDLHRPIPFVVTFRIPCLDQDDGMSLNESLEWSSRVLGTDRASLEHFDKWQVGGGSRTFEIDPHDLIQNGPHRLIIDVKVRTVGLTMDWEHALPQVPFLFEFDPVLRPESLLASEDDERARRFASAVQFVVEEGESENVEFMPLDAQFAIRGTPRLLVTGPLPCDLAHAISLEIEGVEGQLEAGGIVMTREKHVSSEKLVPSGEWSAVALDRPGTMRMRAVLPPDTHRGWSDPSVRSIWPGTIRTEWVEVRVVRR